jgi:predicted RecB family endonuclease
MTTQQRITIAHIVQQHEAERFQASQASREVAELDVVSVLYAVEAKLAAGLIDEAKAIVQAYRASKGGN